MTWWARHAGTWGAGGQCPLLGGPQYVWAHQRGPDVCAACRAEIADVEHGCIDAQLRGQAGCCMRALVLRVYHQPTAFDSGCC